MKMSQTRSQFIDFLKFILIILVIIGHAIQFMKCANYGFYDNLVFKAIYTFHMPLFLGISGYYAYSSIQRTTLQQFIISKLKYALIPIFSWGLILSIALSINDSFTFTSFIRYFIYTTTHQYWFIWAVFLFPIILSIFSKYKIDTPVFLFIASVLLFFVPLQILKIDVSKSYFIYYMLPYLLVKYSVDKKLFESFNKLIPVSIITVLSVILFLIWNPANEPSNVMSSAYWKYYAFRTLLGILSSISVFLILHTIYNTCSSSPIVKKVSTIGCETLGIYFIHDLFFNVFVRYFMQYELNIYSSNTFLLVFSFAFCLISYFLIKVLCYNQFLAFIFFGKKLIQNRISK